MKDVLSRPKQKTAQLMVPEGAKVHMTLGGKRCYEPTLATTKPPAATTRSIYRLVPRTGLDCLTASKTGYPRNRF